MVEPLRIGNISANREEMKCGVVEGVELFDGARLDIPIMVMNCAADGPIFLVASNAMHCRNIESQGIEIIRRVMREEIDPKGLSGSIVAVPEINPLALHSSLDIGNIYRIFYIISIRQDPFNYRDSMFIIGFHNFMPFPFLDKLF